MKFCSLFCNFLTSQSEFDFGIALVTLGMPNKYGIHLYMQHTNIYHGEYKTKSNKYNFMSPISNSIERFLIHVDKIY
jgi:hypothetical protein